VSRLIGISPDDARSEPATHGHSDDSEGEGASVESSR
jgi:hypothetical protein